MDNTFGQRVGVISPLKPYVTGRLTVDRELSRVFLPLSPGWLSLACHHLLAGTRGEHLADAIKRPQKRAARASLGRFPIPYTARANKLDLVGARFAEDVAISPDKTEIALRAAALVLHDGQEPGFPGAAVAEIPQGPLGRHVTFEIAPRLRALDLCEQALHLTERLVRTSLGSQPGKARLNPQAQALDLLQFLRGEPGDARATTGNGDNEPVALQETQGLTDRRGADTELPRQLDEAQLPPGLQI